MRRKLKAALARVITVIRCDLLLVDTKLPFLARAVRRVPKWGWASGFVALVFVSSLFIYASRAHALSQGPYSPGTAANTTGTGSVAWSSPGNALASDSAYATASLGSGAISNYLTVTNFGFTIPTGSVVDGIEADVEDAISVGSAKAQVQDNVIETIKGGTIGGTNLANTSAWSSAGEVYVPYGGSSALWGQTWLPSDINSSNFGIAISAKNVKLSSGGATLTAEVDYVRVTVYYSPPPSTLGQASYRLFNNQDAATTSATFIKGWDGSSYDTAKNVVQTSDGGYAIAGYTESYGSGVGTSEDAFLSKYDKSGALSWTQTWGGTSNETEGGLVQTSDGGYAMCGQTYSYGDTTYGDAFITKYTSTGAVSWSASWGSTTGAADLCNGLVQTSDGGYAITGETKSFGDTTNGDAFIAKFSSTGALSWSTTWGGSTTGLDDALAIVQTSDGGYAIAGETQSLGDTKGDAFIARFDSSGNYLWDATWGSTTGQDFANALVQTSDGYIIVGQTYSYGDTTNGDAFMAKFTVSGTGPYTVSLAWSTTWGGATGNDSASSIIQTSDGNFAVTGYTASYGAGGGDAFLAKFTNSGSLSWLHTYGGAGQDGGDGLVQTSDGGYALTGSTYSFADTTNGDAWLVKVDSSGDISGKCDSTVYCTAPTLSSVSQSAASSSPTTINVTHPSAYSITMSSSTSSPTVTDQVIVGFTPPAMNVGTPLAAQNTAATVSDGVPFRLRIDINVTTNQLNAAYGSFKLQYAPMTTSCDASFTNTPSSAYQDVTDTSTVRYYNNPNGFNGAALTTNANDPNDGPSGGYYPIVYETYQQEGMTSFTDPTAIPAGSDGLWDFALETYHALQNTNYCLRIVSYSSGTETALNTYTTYGGGSGVAEIMLPASTYTQGGYRLFQPSPGTPITFANAWGDPNNSDYAYSVVQTSDGGYAVTGITGQTSNGGGEAFLNKYTAAGSLTWSDAWWSAGTSAGESVVQTSDGGYAVAGYTTSSPAASYDAFLAKFDSSGTMTWSRTWGGANSDYAYSLVQTSDGGYAMCGQTYSYGDTTHGDAFVAKFTVSNNVPSLSWSLTWGGTTGQDYAQSIIQTSDGNYAITGQTHSYGSDTTNGDAFIAKIKSDGSGVLWSTTWAGGTGGDSGYKIIQTSDGGYAITGGTTATTSAYSDAFLAKFDLNGTHQWSATWGGSSTDQAYSVIQTSDGNYVIAGETSSYGVADADAFIAKLTVSGSGPYTVSTAWSRTWGGGAFDYGYTAIQTSDGGYAVAGSTTSFGDTSNGDIFLAKFDSSENIYNCGSICEAPSVTAGTPTVASSASTVTPGIPTITLGTPSASTFLPPYATTVIIPEAGGATVGTPLDSENQPYDATRAGSQFILRQLVDVSGGGTLSSGVTLKLQYARRGSDNVCDTSFNGETYQDVTASTPVYYYNGSGNSGDPIALSSSDPTDGTSTNVAESYQEANNFTNIVSPIYALQSGEWDFSLAIQPGTLVGGDYCLRVVTSSGSTISYSNIVDIAYGPSMSALLRDGQWWDRAGARQGFFTPASKQP